MKKLLVPAMLFVASLLLNIYFLFSVNSVSEKEKSVQVQMDSLEVWRQRYFDDRERYGRCLYGMHLALGEVGDKFLSLSDKKNGTKDMLGRHFLDDVFAKSKAWEYACEYGDIIKEFGYGYDGMDDLSNNANWDTVAWVMEAKELELRGIKAAYCRRYREKYNEVFYPEPKNDSLGRVKAVRKKSLF